MGTAERSQARVENHLADLEGTYESFPVNQRTLTVAGERYERARRQYEAGVVDSYVRIVNDDGDVLQVTDDKNPGLPGGPDYPGVSERALEARVATETGVRCAIEDLAEVTIAGISNADSDDPVLYRLVVVFEGTYQAGEPAEDIEWCPPDGAVESALV